MFLGGYGRSKKLFVSIASASKWSFCTVSKSMVQRAEG